jgi:hypothetical protein
MNENRSPVEQAEDAKRNRDLGGELGALLGGSATLERQPWYPPRPGDVVHVHYEAVGDSPASGDTYVIQHNGPGDEWMDLTPLTNTAPPQEGGGYFAVTCDPDPLFQVWMEAGPHRITVVRDGVVVHNGPASRGQ